ncbi:MAG: alpha/beta hydrolase [Synoicihabitans sp.]
MLRCFLTLALLASGLSADYDVHSLWPKGAPGSESRAHEPEQAKDWWVKNIHNPSVTVVPADPTKATGAAVVVLAGGGHRQLVFPPEGLEPAEWFAARGVTAFAVKYRLAREPGSTYSLEQHAATDARRAMRWVRHHATQFNIDPDRIGIMGWSAGGELSAMVSFGDHNGLASARDPIDRESCRPDFHLSIYPGPIGFPAGKLNPATPPTFFICAMDDEFHVAPILAVLPKFMALGIPVETHLYAAGGHGFNMGNRSDRISIRNFPDRMIEWMQDEGWLENR